MPNTNERFKAAAGKHDAVAKMLSRKKQEGETERQLQKRMEFIQNELVGDCPHCGVRTSLCMRMQGDYTGLTFCRVGECGQAYNALEDITPRVYDIRGVNVNRDYEWPTFV